MILINKILAVPVKTKEEIAAEEEEKIAKKRAMELQKEQGKEEKTKPEEAVDEIAKDGFHIDAEVKIEMDATGGNNYTFMGTNQMMSVPYALYAENAQYDQIVQYTQYAPYDPNSLILYIFKKTLRRIA